MESTRWKLLREVLESALEMDPSDRQAWVDHRCDGDPALRSLAIRMLEDSHETATLLEPLTPKTEPKSDEVLDDLRDRSEGGSRYQFKGEVARGGMGVVLDVYDAQLKRPLAMKMILGQAEGSRRPVDARSIRRFVTEAEVTGRLQHPGIVPVHDLGVDPEGHVYFTMRMVKGKTLEDVIESQRARRIQSRRGILGSLLRACEAMAYAHDQGVIHRDLKPSNIMIGEYGEVYVMDWGLAKNTHEAERCDIRIDRDATPPGTGDSALMTMDGDIVGTPCYMSPEQARGQIDNMGPASDVYSMGAILYHILSKRRPYDDGSGTQSPIDILDRVNKEAPEPLGDHDPDLPIALVEICERAMHRDPEQRFADMGELAAAINRYLDPEAQVEKQDLRKSIPLATLYYLILLASIVSVIGGSLGALFLTHVFFFKDTPLATPVAMDLVDRSALVEWMVSLRDSEHAEAKEPLEPPDFYVHRLEGAALESGAHSFVRFGEWMVALVEIALWMASLVLLTYIVQDIRSGRPFSEKNVARVRLIGWGVIVWTVCSMAHEWVVRDRGREAFNQVAKAHELNGVEGRMLTIEGLSHKIEASATFAVWQPSLYSLSLGVLILILARVFAVGCKLEEGKVTMRQSRGKPSRRIMRKRRSKRR